MAEIEDPSEVRDEVGKRWAMVQYDRETEEYFIVLEDGTDNPPELGPMTEEELRDVTNGCATEFGYSGEF